MAASVAWPVECIIIANDATVKGGTYYPMTVKKHLRAQEIALQNTCRASTSSTPVAHFLPRQDEVFPDRDHFGRIFFNQATMSAKGIAQIAAVMGSCTAGGAYVPCNERRGHHRQESGTIFLGGPPLVKAATGEVVTAEELGGGDLHSKVSGVTDHLADDDRDALRRVRKIVSTLGPPRRGHGMSFPPETRSSTESEIYDVVPTTTRTPYDVREVITRVVDAGEFGGSKPNTARHSSPDSPASTAIPSGSSPTTVCCSPNLR